MTTYMKGVPAGWRSVPLAELAAPGPNSITDGPFGSKLKTEHYTEAGPRVVRLQNIGDGVFCDERAHISEAHFATLQKHRVFEGDLVIAALGETLPRACIVPGTLGPAIVKADCIRFKPDAAQVSNKYLLYALLSPQVRHAAATIIHGVGRPRLNQSEIKSLPVPLAPRAEQDSIVAEIDKQFTRLDAGLDALHRLQTHLRRYRTALLNAAFKPHWPRVRFGSLLREPLRNGHSAPKSQTGSGVRTLTLSAVTEGIFSEENTKITSADPDRVRDLWLRPGDLLIERSNTPELVGTARVYRGPRDWAIFPDLLIRARLKPDVSDRFVEHFLASEQARDYFRRSAQGIAGSMPKISQPTIEELMVPVPPLSEQQEMAAAMDAAMTQADATERFSRAAMHKAERLRSSVLCAAFDGRLVGAELPARITA